MIPVWFLGLVLMAMAVVFAAVVFAWDTIKHVASLARHRVACVRARARGVAARNVDGQPLSMGELHLLGDITAGYDATSPDPVYGQGGPA